MAKFSEAFLERMGTPGLFEKAAMQTAGKIAGLPAQMRQQQAAERQRQTAMLEASGQQMADQATALANRRRNELLMKQAIQAANRAGDTEAMRAIGLGALDPAEYLRNQATEQETDNDYRKGDEVTIRDSKGNTFLQYTIQDINNPSAKPVVKTVPIGNSPAEPVGNTTIVSGTTGAGAFDKPEISGNVRKAQEFSDLQVQAANNLPDLQSEARILDDAVAALETMPSQGLPEVIVDKFRREFGIQDPDIAEYELLVGELMFSRLKPLFGGVISEGEREAIMGLYNNLKRGNPANKRILMQLHKKIKESIVKANLIRKSNSFDEYNATLDRLYPSDGEQPEENVIDFSQLP